MCVHAKCFNEYGLEFIHSEQKIKLKQHFDYFTMTQNSFDFVWNKYFAPTSVDCGPNLFYHRFYLQKYKKCLLRALTECLFFPQYFNVVLTIIENSEDQK